MARSAAAPAPRRLTFDLRCFALLALLGAAGCLRPASLRAPDMLARVAADYRAFFPAGGDPDLRRDIGLLRPRFGLPEFVAPGAPFHVEVLERGDPPPPRLALVRAELTAQDASRCLDEAARRPAAPQRGPAGLPGLRGGSSLAPGAAAVAPIEGCYPLRILATHLGPLPGGGTRAVLTVAPVTAPPPRGYDLYVESAVDAPARAPRAVWLRAAGEGPRPLRVAQLSDLHIGKGHADLRDNLRRVLADVNARRPDLVLITGDIANLGTRADLMEEARDWLLLLDAPVVVVPGNHDLGFDLTAIFRSGLGSGWATFARSFHPYLYFSFTLAGWDFVGFDSGASVPSPRVLTRGVSDTTVATIREALDQARRDGRRGVVLLSHAPTRALLITGTDPASAGLVGHMWLGGRAFEREMLAAASGLRVLHLSGHTHWADVFEATAPPGQRPGRFHRWPAAQVNPCLHPLLGRVTLINAQSASHTTFPLRRNAQGYGFAWLLLDEPAPQLAFVRYNGPVPEACGEPQVARAVPAP